MSGLSPGDDPGVLSGNRDSPIRDRTPEREEIERTVTPVGRARFDTSRFGLVAGLVAVVAALLLINFGGNRDKQPANTMAMTPDTKAHPDQHAKQDVPFDPAGQPGSLPSALPQTAQMTTLPDGTVVPAIQPGAMPPGASPDSADTLAQKAQRAPLLVAVGGNGQDQGGDTARVDRDDEGAIAPEDVGAHRSAGGDRGAGELDRLRQSSAIGSSHASMLPARDYLVTAGTLIPCILQTAMNSTQPGYTSCIVPRDVYSDNGRVVLLEKGTKVLGQYQGGINQGQGRIFVLWTRAVTPRGVAIDLASPASDALGRAGMAGAIDTFFWARFGAALMLSLIDDASAVASTHFANEGSNTTQVPSNTAGTALQNTINIKPVLKKNQGEEVAIFVAQDFNFADVYGLALKP